MIDISLSDNGVFVMCMKNGKANALGKEFMAELQQAVHFASNEDRVKGVLLKSASPKIFCGGLDLGQISSFVSSDDPVGNFREFIFDFLAGCCKSLLNCPKPVAACVNGHCLAGGLVLALSTDYIAWGPGNYCFLLFRTRVH